jgi:hypothetical protein
MKNDEVYLQLKILKQKSIEWVEVYYELLLKLVNNLHTPTTNILMTMFRSKLQSYLCIITIGMKMVTLQQHKDLALLCEEGILEFEAQSFLLIFQVSKTIGVTIILIVARKPNMYCINCHCTHPMWRCVKIRRNNNQLWL